MARISETSPVRLVHLVHLVYLVHLVSFVQPNKPDRPNRPNEQDWLADFFSILLKFGRMCADRRTTRYVVPSLLIEGTPHACPSSDPSGSNTVL
jgi:hypothetical protein